MLLAAASQTLAQGTAHPHPQTRDPIHVNECLPRPPSPGVAAPYGPIGPVWSGYYWPAVGGYYWRDPYGYNVQQLSTPPELAIHYRNITTTTATTVDFGLIANGNLVAEVRDVGTFSPHAEIKHTFGLSPNVFPLQTGLPICLPLHVVFADGTSWTSSHLPALQHRLLPH